MINHLTVTCIRPSPDVITTLQNKLGGQYILHTITERSDFIPTLVQQQPALLLIDGDQPDWREWAVATISNNATRRIPIIVYVESLTIFHSQAPQSGITASLSRSALLNQTEKIVQQYARYLTAEQSALLDCDCQSPLPPQAQQAIEQFNAGEYYRQHDLFEALWMETASPIRELYRAILQIGIAYYQITRHNRNGAIKMLERSRQWLNGLPDVCQGVDIQALRDDSHQVYQALLNSQQITNFDYQLLQPIKQISVKN